MNLKRFYLRLEGFGSVPRFEGGYGVEAVVEGSSSSAETGRAKKVSSNS